MYPSRSPPLSRSNHSLLVFVSQLDPKKTKQPLIDEIDRENMCVFVVLMRRGGEKKCVILRLSEERISI